VPYVVEEGAVCRLPYGLDQVIGPGDGGCVADPAWPMVVVVVCAAVLVRVFPVTCDWGSLAS